MATLYSVDSEVGSAGRISKAVMESSKDHSRVSVLVTPTIEITCMKSI